MSNVILKVRPVRMVHPEHPALLVRLEPADPLADSVMSESTEMLETMDPRVLLVPMAATALREARDLRELLLPTEHLEHQERMGWPVMLEPTEHQETRLDRYLTVCFHTSGSSRSPRCARS
jgi:hypothetical protein